MGFIKCMKGVVSAVTEKPVIKRGVTVPGKAGLTTERVTTTLICSRTSRRGSSYLSPSQFRF